MLFHYLSPKPYLCDLIPQGHVDFHSHLIPGIDDGARTLEDALELIEELRALGIDRVITTPHIMQHVWDNDERSIQGNLAQLRANMPANLQPQSLSAAAEYLMDGTFMDRFRNTPLLTLKDNYVLVEMSYLNPPIQLYDILFELQVAGYKPVLAHPERYLFFHAKFQEYERLKHAGCSLQLNLLSVIGYYGSEVAEVAKKLLKKGLIDFAGSDVHHKNHLAGFSRRVLFKDVQPLKEALAHNQIFR